jgi:hypothetical protein
MSNTIYTSQSHYVYRITNILINKHYYGSRSCKNCHPKDDLGIKYFSSSTDKNFKKDQKDHPEYYRYKIIRICKTRKDADELEILLHKKFKVAMNESFYNKCEALSTGFNITGKKHTEAARKKMSAAQKREKNPFFGKTHSEEARKKLSEANKGEKHPRFKGYYITPFGILSSTKDLKLKENNIGAMTLLSWCKTNNNTIISKKSYGKSKYLRENFDESIIGKTYKNIGFSFENKISNI